MNRQLPLSSVAKGLGLSRLLFMVCLMVRVVMTVRRMCDAAVQEPPCLYLAKGANACALLCSLVLWCCLCSLLCWKGFISQRRYIQVTPIVGGSTHVRMSECGVFCVTKSRFLDTCLLFSRVRPPRLWLQIPLSLAGLYVAGGPLCHSPSPDSLFWLYACMYCMSCAFRFACCWGIHHLKDIRSLLYCKSTATRV